MANRVTIQDIADALGLSRNTVSKAINNTGILASHTRERILKKAVEMGYKQFSYVNIDSDPLQGTAITLKTDTNQNNSQEVLTEEIGVIALFTGGPVNNSHFASTMLDRFQRELSKIGYSFMIYHVKQNDMDQKRLPSSFNPDLVRGIMCLELFDMDYAEFLCSLGPPVLFVDGPVETMNRKLQADLLIMDNYTGVRSLVRELIAGGVTQFGFIGEIGHCRSFRERYVAMRLELLANGLSFAPEHLISFSDTYSKKMGSEEYQEFLCHHLSGIKKLPEVFLCANDFIAIDILTAFRTMGIRVPDDVMLAGFDDSAESRTVTPALSTVHIHSQIMGVSAVDLLLSRIQHPSMNYRTVYTETTLIMRQTTIPL